MEVIPGHLVDLPQIGELTIAGFLLRRAFPGGHGDAQLLCLHADGVEISDILDQREELERIAACMTAKAVEKAFIRHNGERWRLFMMKGAAAPITVSPPFHGDIALHDLQDVRLCVHLCHKGIHGLTVHRAAHLHH